VSASPYMDMASESGMGSTSATQRCGYACLELVCMSSTDVGLLPFGHRKKEGSSNCISYFVVFFDCLTFIPASPFRL